MPNPQVQNDPIYGLPFLYINGLQISNDATTPNTILDIAAGQCRDSNNIMDIPVGSAPLDGLGVSAPLTVNSAIVGAGGIDRGAVAASTMYAIYLIADSRYYKPAAGIMTVASNSTPLVPFGYDSVRLIGYWPTNGSSQFIKGYVSGAGSARSFTYDAPVATAITAGAATSYTAVDLSATVPPVNNIPVSIKNALTPGAAGRGIFLQGAASTGDQIVNLGQVTSVVLNNTDVVLAQLASSLPKINYKVSNAGDAVALSVAGYQFTL